MAIGVYFPEANFTTKQYDEAVKKLEEAGVGMPKGRLYHASFGDANNLQIFDVWASQEDFDKFGEKLIPILASVNYTPPQPMIAPVHSVIKGG
jgi:hypothetical protein